MFMKFLTANWPFYVCAAVFTAIFLAHMYLIDAPVVMQEGISDVSQYGERAIETKHYQLPPLSLATGFLAGIIAGGLLGAMCSKKVRLQMFSPRTGRAMTIPCGIAGGFMIMFGGMIAGDIVLGHIVAAFQLSIGSWIYLGCAFLTAHIILSFWTNAEEQRNQDKNNPGNNNNNTNNGNG